MSYQKFGEISVGEDASRKVPSFDVEDATPTVTVVNDEDATPTVIVVDDEAVKDTEHRETIKTI